MGGLEIFSGFSARRNKRRRQRSYESRLAQIERAFRPLFCERLEDRCLMAAPVVTGLSVTSGPAAGGTQVTISGTGFDSGMGVFFGTKSATGLFIFNLINRTY